MEHALRCNALKCRTQLDESAVVTTCSHIFCVSCSDKLGLSNPTGSTRKCPACETQLTNPDDAVVAQLNPSEDYKTSVLSGLSPNTILECAGRALNFYSYQTSQEIVYQEYLARSLTDNYQGLSDQMDSIIENANGQINNMSNKLEVMHEEKRKLEEKNEKLAEAYREKGKKQQQLQRLYNQLKQQQLAAGLEVAAKFDAENALQEVATAPRTNNQRGGVPLQSRAGSNGSGGNDGQRRPTNAWDSYHQPANQRASLHTSRSLPVPMTPSGHRTRLPQPLYGNDHAGPDLRGDSLHRGTPQRTTLNNLDPNVYGNSNRYGGMSAGVKVGRQQHLAQPYHGAVGGGRVSGLNLR